jgi:hypothetical protein
MTNTDSIARRLTALIVLTASLSTPGFAQRLGVSVGYSRMTGEIGSLASNEGIAVRVGAELNPRSIFRVGVEAGMDRHNEHSGSALISCLHPAGGTATCYFNSRERDTGWSLAAILRAGPNAGQIRPYVLVGLGFLSVRARSKSTATDSTGAHLTNFEFDGTRSESVYAAPLGGGVLFRPSGSPIGVGIEARMTPLLYSYDGGRIGVSPSLVMIVRW